MTLSSLPQTTIFHPLRCNTSTMVKLLHLLYAKQQQQLQATQEHQKREEEDSRKLLNLFSQQGAKARKEEEDKLAIILALEYLSTPGYCSV
ncbi:hypothetical protein PCANC_21415 [Puccinia coronata f. sp. avenae]|uniref:Uncharacterized protein n=1 Tax=Puccinia coronata f. sp. avenae TaxID=200324 RepID=A0A2N5UTB3_9BASI|nr:hypothetical protein PCANC_28209 [Puccinia coronata f. sp. avenae]PLW41010.1 hypothetical protein PCANC_21415 [Puccinia coronata f. sp. avenae]